MTNIGKILWKPLKVTDEDLASYPENKYLVKVNNRNIVKKSEICSKLTIKKPERVHWRCSGFFVVNLNIFHILFCGFYCWLWTCKCLLGTQTCCCQMPVFLICITSLLPRDIKGLLIYATEKWLVNFSEIIRKVGRSVENLRKTPS